MSSRCEGVLKRLYALQRFGIRPGLWRIKKLLAALGDPHRAYPSIHVAGTNGKGSTSSIIQSVLSQRYRTGLYTSPHLERFNERIRINGSLITDGTVVRTAAQVEAAAKRAGLDTLTFFEFTTAMAFLHFREKKAEAAVIETGMGGRWDATNVVTPVVSVITTIGLDHTEFLGPDIRSVAFEKAGIIKNSVPVVTGVDKRAALIALKETARKRNSPILTLGKSFKATPSGTGKFDYSGPAWELKDLSVRLKGAHQYRNAACALAALEAVSGRLKVTETAIRRGLAGVEWPGRVEVLGKRPLVILDAAHNPEGAAALKEALAGFKYSRLILVIGVMADKDIDGIFRHLIPVSDTVVLAMPDTARAAEARTLYAKALPYGKKAVAAGSVKEACRAAMNQARPSDAVCVTGSFFTVGEARGYLKRVVGKTR